MVVHTHTIDYTPSSPPPPPPLPHPHFVSCLKGLNGTKSLATTCNLNSNLFFDSDVYIEGNGSLNILPNVNLSFPILGCMILINMSREFSLQSGVVIIVGTVHVSSKNVSLLDGLLIKVTGLADAPPAQTSGTPSGTQGAGGGHGGRGATCVSDNTKLPDDVWGGDAYSWSTLDKPCSYGSKGGTTSKDERYGGEGGGRIWFAVNDTIELYGDLLENGSDGGIKGGGGSGGTNLMGFQSFGLTGQGPK
ncbi:hypothetical protein SESBI_42908 [Sesbania bispinosa]|nr:hypothetical protein SESBI_42908 [Sesbania bispinosa]